MLLDLVQTKRSELPRCSVKVAQMDAVPMCKLLTFIQLSFGYLLPFSPRTMVSSGSVSSYTCVASTSGADQSGMGTAAV